ncbi:MAG: cob(I)yrinic acid a,c-diamide adenosyltransferase [Thiohalomonadaceae bacterium]
MARLTRIYTRTGDDGTTRLAGRTRVHKDSARIEAIGTLDELNSHLGVVLTHALPDGVRQCLAQVQNDLFDLGGELSTPGRASLDGGYVSRLERWLDEFNAELPPLREFILPGGSPSAAVCHVARSVCRRAERRLVACARNETLNPQVMAYVNRLSDLLFVLARVLAREQGHEVYWQPGLGATGD